MCGNIATPQKLNTIIKKSDKSNNSIEKKYCKYIENDILKNKTYDDIYFPCGLSSYMQSIWKYASNKI